MICSRCNYYYDGTVCPICNTPANIQPPNLQAKKPVICSNCGNISLGRFCSNCGAPVTDDSAASSASNNPINSANQTGFAYPPKQNFQDNTAYQAPPQGNAYKQTPPHGNPMHQNAPYINPSFQSTPYNMQYTPAYTAKKSRLIPIVMASFGVLLVLSVVALFVVSIVSFGTVKSVNGAEGAIRNPVINGKDGVSFPAGVSLEEYKKLKIGMTYAQVSAIIGGDGQPLSSEKGEGKKTLYIWQGQDIPQAIVSITFEYGKVIKIEQENLF